METSTSKIWETKMGMRGRVTVPKEIIKMLGATKGKKPSFKLDGKKAILEFV